MRVAINAVGRVVWGYLSRIRVEVGLLSVALSLIFIVSACTTRRLPPPAAVCPESVVAQRVAALPMPAKPIASPSRAAWEPLPPWARVRISDVAACLGFASYNVHGKLIALQGESMALAGRLRATGIEALNACTLVLLKTGQFDL